MRVSNCKIAPVYLIHDVLLFVLAGGVFFSKYSFEIIAICARVDQLLILGMVLPHLMTGILIMGP